MNPERARLVDVLSRGLIELPPAQPREHAVQLLMYLSRNGYVVKRRSGSHHGDPASPLRMQRDRALVDTVVEGMVIEGHRTYPPSSLYPVLAKAADPTQGRARALREEGDETLPGADNSPAKPWWRRPWSWWDGL